MRHIRRLLLTIIIFAGATYSASAQSDSLQTEILRPVLSSFSIEVGSASILDTYLSPIRYKGTNVRIGYEGLKSLSFRPESWFMQGCAAIEYANAQNIAKNHTMHSLMVDGKWGMMHKWKDMFVNRLDLSLGGSIQLRGGAIYCAQNSNNPVSVKIRSSFNISGMATYNFKISKLPITLRYQATVPTIGAFFSLDYGESFYELYLGNRSGIVNFGWWGNRFDMENLATADLHLGSCILRVGYRNLIETSWVHNLNTQICTHGFVIGISGDWLQINTRKSLSPKTKVISAMY